MEDCVEVLGEEVRLGVHDKGVEVQVEADGGDGDHPLVGRFHNFLIQQRGRFT